MSYIEAIGRGFPGVGAHAVGDGTVYEDIVWESGLPLPSKETLDAWIASNGASNNAKLTVLAFRNRFTMAEKIAIDFASIDNPNADMQTRQFQAAIRVMLADIAAATFIDTQRADTRAGVQQLETAGILATGRASQILDTPATAIELYAHA